MTVHNSGYVMGDIFMYTRKSRKQMGMIVFASILFIVAILGCMRNERAQRIEESALFRQSHSYFEDVSFKKTTDDQQQVRLFKVESELYYAYLPQGLKDASEICFQQFEKLQIDGKSYVNGNLIKDMQEGHIYEITAFGWDGKTVETAKLEVFYEEDLPAVFIGSQNGSLKAVDANRSLKENIKIKILDSNGEIDTEGDCTIKSRGNSSYRDIEQKSYSLKLKSEQSVLGLSAGTEWALLANYRDDLQQMKNKVSLDVAKMLGAKYTPDSQFVNLYVDGQYQGMYLLTQRISSDGGSVKIHDLEKENEHAMTTGVVPENISGGYLLEFDIRATQEEGWFPLNSQTVRVKSPEKLLDEELTYIMYYMKKVEYILHSENGVNADTGESYQDCMDMESWIKMYLLQEFFVQYDAEFSSFYMYKEKDDPLIYAGPIWDFDLAYGSVWEGNYPKVTARTLMMKDKEGWLAELDRYPEFHEQMMLTYQKEFAGIIEKYMSENFAGEIESIQQAYAMNALRWGRELQNVQKEAEKMQTWILERKDFWDEYSKDEDSFTKVTFCFDWGNLSYYSKTGEKIGLLPQEIYGQIDKRAAEEYTYGLVSGWQDENGNVITEDEIMTEDCMFYAIYETK